MNKHERPRQADIPDVPTTIDGPILGYLAALLALVLMLFA